MSDEQRNSILQPDLPAEEPREVVSWYTAAEEPQEIVSCYVHPSPLPERLVPQAVPDTSAWRAAARREKRRRRIGVWSFVGSMAVIALVITLSLLLGNGSSAAPDDGWQGEDENNASSIVDIFGRQTTAIPRYTGDVAAWLKVETETGEPLTASEVYAKVNPAVVTVVTEIGGDRSKVGTGVILTPDGYIVTNAHVISEGVQCVIILDTGYVYEAQLVGYDADEDLAILHALEAEDLPVAEFGDSDRLAVGQTVYAIGNPLGIELRGTFTEGMVSAVNREVTVNNGAGSMTMIQTTAALNSGNSGGPLINEYGQVVGINTLKMSNTGWEEEATVEALGFAIPVSTAVFAINDLIVNGEYRGMPMIGISVITVEDDSGATCVEVYSVEAGLGGEKAGIQPGDVVLEADGVALRETLDLLAVRRNHLAGDTMHLTLLRNGQTVAVDVVLIGA